MYVSIQNLTNVFYMKVNSVTVNLAQITQKNPRKRASKKPESITNV